MSNASEVRHVLVIEDQKSRRIVSLTENNYDIGRDPNSAIPLFDRQVSRHHATLLRVNEYQNEHFSYRLIDGNLQGKRSTNGIMVNAQYCLSHELKHGDLIRFSSKSKASYHVISITTESDLDALQNDVLGSIHLVKSKGTYPGVGTETIAGDEAISSLEEVEAGLDVFDDDRGEDSAFNTAILDQGLKENDEPISKDLGKSPTVQTKSLPSLAEYSPTAIVEFSFGGEITYLNPAAIRLFPDLQQAKQKHPILEGLLSLTSAQEGTSFARELEIVQKCYEQHVHFSAELQLVCCYLYDITFQRRLERDQKRLRQRYQVYRQLGSEGVLIVDVKTKSILDANPAYCQMLGYTEVQLLDLNLYQLVELERDIVDANLDVAQQQEPFLWQNISIRSEAGTLHSVSVTIYQSLWDGKPAYCLIVKDGRGQQKNDEAIAFQHLHDPITQIPNRPFLLKQLEVALDHARRHEHLFAVLFLSLESWRTINHSLGHSTGDLVLQVVEKRLQSCIKQGDSICHWGGELFCVLLPLIKNTEDPIKVSDRIFKALQEPVMVSGQELVLLANIGIAIYPDDGENLEDLLKNADTALGQIERKGTYHHQFFNPRLSEEARLTLRLERLLESAISKKQFTLVYQPQVNLVTNKITGMEALLRWEHPEVGTIPPKKLIDLAVKTGLIFEIGQWVIRTACQQNLVWQKAGIAPFTIGINLSGREFYQETLTAMVATTLNDTGLDPQWLELEITEQSLQRNPSLSKKILQELTELGTRIALDGFGRGYSSLGLVHSLPLHTLKLDQAMIRDLRGTSQEKGVVEAILSLAQGFNLRAIAEGVETEQQLNWLRQWQCQEIQGYWFSRPLKVKDATQFLQQQAAGNNSP
ncbi:MAG: EAL domain-containing protein [Microcystaceae cyanobacterium]